MKVLVAEDNPASARLMERALIKAGHQVAIAGDGAKALEALRAAPVDALLTDWMMPNMDGIELIRRVRQSIYPVPFIMVITALDTSNAKAYALDSGADDFLGKPVTIPEMLARLTAGYARLTQATPRVPLTSVPPVLAGRPPFVAVAIAASTGGPTAVRDMLATISPTDRAAFFIVQHGPAWMLEAYAGRLGREISLPVRLARDGMAISPGAVYLAPGERHLLVEPGVFVLRLDDGPPENFIRPAADPLFRSVARAFGRYSVGLVMTGMGRDGAAGCAAIQAVGGPILVQDPATAAVSSMPQTVIEMGLVSSSLPIAEIGPAIIRYVDSLSADLGRRAGVA